MNMNMFPLVVLAATFAFSRAHCVVEKTLGCFLDQNHHRLLDYGFQADHGQYMTQTACLQLCDNQNMTFAATEFGKQCFCGHTFPKSAHKLPDSSCNQTCHDGSNCGGVEALFAATYSCSGKPDKVPKGHTIERPKPGPPAGPPPYPKTQPCAQAPLKGTPTCDSSKPIDDRVADLVSRIGEATSPRGTLYNMFSDQSPGVPELVYGRSIQTKLFHNTTVSSTACLISKRASKQTYSGTKTQTHKKISYARLLAQPEYCFLQLVVRGLAWRLALPIRRPRVLFQATRRLRTVSHQVKRLRPGKFPS